MFSHNSYLFVTEENVYSILADFVEKKKRHVKINGSELYVTFCCINAWVAYYSYIYEVSMTNDVGKLLHSSLI